MTVQPGCITGFVGNNGAGKTTTIHSLLGFLKPHAGSVRVLGLDPRRDAKEIRYRVGFFPERDQPYEWIRLRTLFDMGAAAYPDWDGQLCKRLCQQFGLGLDRKVKQLSKGMVAKTKLIFALSHRPECLILDEPTSGLDPATRHELLEMILQLTAEHAVTTLFSSHNLDDVAGIATDLVVIHQGRTLFSERMDAIKDDVAIVELRGGFADPPGALAESIVKVVRKADVSFWLIRDYRGRVVQHWLQRQPPGIRVHRPSLSQVFHFLTRDWVEQWLSEGAD